MSARNFDVFKARKYGNVRVEHDVEMKGEIVHVILHSTVVVRWDREARKVTLNSGGWRTVTTKTAINAALRQMNGFEGLRVYQEKGEWFVYHGLQKFPYDDGMSLKIVDGILKVIP